MAIDADGELREVIERWLHFTLAPFADDRDADIWQDWRNPSGDVANAILETEQVLSFFYPQDTLPEWRLEAMSSNASKELRETVRGFKSVSSYSGFLQVILEFLITHFERNVGKDGQQNFQTPAYFAPDSKISNASVTDAYSMGMSLCIICKRLAHRIINGHPDVGEEDETMSLAEKLWTLSDERLTECLRGLLSAFAVNAANADGWHANGDQGVGMWAWPGEENDQNAGHRPTIAKLREIKKRLTDLGFSIGVGQAFECGWSWGPIVRSKTDWNWLYGQSGTRKISGEQAVWKRVIDHAANAPVSAENAPYLYFTVIALDGLEDLFSPELESSGLLNSEQVVLAARLRTLETLTREFWEALALSPPRNDQYRDWLVERIPWRTADGKDSPYWNLFLLRIIAPRLSRSEDTSARLVRLTERLAEAGVILREPIPSASDPALNLHWPGLLFDLAYTRPEAGKSKKGSYEIEKDAWAVYDFAPQLMKVCIRFQGLSESPRLQLRWTALIEEIWKHLAARRDEHTSRGRGWDRIDKVFREFTDSLRERGAFDAADGTTVLPWKDHESGDDDRNCAVASWYYTERVIEGLTALCDLKSARQGADSRLRDIAQAMLVELGDSVSDRALLDEMRRNAESRPGDMLVTLIERLIREKREL